LHEPTIKKTLSPLEKKFYSSLVHRVSPGDRVLAAVSGGADSVAMLHLLHEARGKGGYELAVAHLDHTTRGGESEEDARFVRALAERLNLPVFVETISVFERRRELKTSFQEAARIVRYDFLERTLKAWGGNKISLGHTADDQVETVLIQLLRGSGPSGLAGMPPERGSVIRPLLDSRREEIEEYLVSRQLEFRTDATNAQPLYLRNRVRSELIPVLARFNPRVRSRLLDMAEVIRQEDAFLDDEAHRVYDSVVRTFPGRPRVKVDRKAFLALPPALQYRVIRVVIETLKHDLRQVSFQHVRQVVKLLAVPKTGKTVQLPGHLSAFCVSGGVEMRQNPLDDTGILKRAQENPSFPGALKIPGWTEMVFAGIGFQAESFPSRGEEVPRQESNRAWLDLDKTGDVVRVRFARPGDRFVPLGMQGTKKLKAFFIDEKVPRELRTRIPILTTGEGDIIWIYGYRISNKYRVTPETKHILQIVGIPLSGSQNSCY